MTTDRRVCENCRFWMGGKGSFRSDCVNPANYTHRPAYDETCQGWQGLPQPAVQAGKVAQGMTWAQATKGRFVP